MTEQESAAQQGSPAEQLKQRMKDKATTGVELAATATGQKTGTVAQAVRQTGEQMRSEGQEGQGKVADKVAQPVQRLSGYLSQADTQQLTSDLRQARQKLGQQSQQLKTQMTDRLGQQVATRTSQAGQAVSTLGQAMRSTGEQLRAQGEEGQALLLEVIVARVEPLGAYLSNADPRQLRSDVASYGRQARARLSTATGAVANKREAATAKGSQAAKQTASGVRQQPLLPLLGALAGSVVAARRLSKQPAQRPKPQPPAAQLEPPPDSPAGGGL